VANPSQGQARFRCFYTAIRFAYILFFALWILFFERPRTLKCHSLNPNPARTPAPCWKNLTLTSTMPAPSSAKNAPRNSSARWTGISSRFSRSSTCTLSIPSRFFLPLTPALVCHSSTAPTLGTPALQAWKQTLK
jgi:hypothetical protein